MRRTHALARILAVWLVVHSGAAAAEIYRWTDARGRLHFTERLDQVPPQQRAAARRAAARTAADESDPIQTYSTPTAARAGGRRGPIQIPFQRSGSLLRVNAVVNDDVSVPFFIDTGASGVSLPGDVAHRLGIHIDAETPRVLVRTANGVVERPIVELSAVQLGGARVENLYATVNPSLDVGLLGGAFFNNFVYAVDAAAGVISLSPNSGIRGGQGAREWQDRFRRLRAPLAELEAYLADALLTSAARREELENKRDELRARLEELEREAKRANVPVAWRR